MEPSTFWLNDWSGEVKPGVFYFRSFDLNKFFEKLQKMGHKVVGLEFEDNNVGLIVEKDNEI